MNNLKSLSLQIKTLAEEVRKHLGCGFDGFNNPVLKGFAGGMLLSFPSCDIDSCAATKIFVVDSRFRVLVDEQAEEDVKGKKKK